MSGINNASGAGVSVACGVGAKVVGSGKETRCASWTVQDVKIKQTKTIKRIRFIIIYNGREIIR